MGSKKILEELKEELSGIEFDMPPKITEKAAQEVIREIEDLSFYIRTVQWIGPKDSAYGKGWNDATKAVSRELGLILERGRNRSEEK